MIICSAQLHLPALSIFVAKQCNTAALLNGLMSGHAVGQADSGNRALSHQKLKSRQSLLQLHASQDVQTDSESNTTPYSSPKCLLATLEEVATLAE